MSERDEAIERLNSRSVRLEFIRNFITKNPHLDNKELEKEYDDIMSDQKEVIADAKAIFERHHESRDEECSLL